MAAAAESARADALREQLRASEQARAADKRPLSQEEQAAPATYAELVAAEAGQVVLRAAQRAAVAARGAPCAAEACLDNRGVVDMVGATLRGGLPPKGATLPTRLLRTAALAGRNGAAPEWEKGHSGAATQRAALPRRRPRRGVAPERTPRLQPEPEQRRDREPEQGRAQRR